MIIVEMKKHFQLRALEWWSAGTMSSWGFMVLAFPHMFEENPAALALVKLAPQHVWGLAAFIVGFTRVVALLINGLWYRTPAIRWICAMLSVLIWFFVAAGFTSSPIINMGTVIYGWHMIADMYSAFRSASDFIEADAQNRLKKMSLIAFPPSSVEEGNVHNITAR